MVCQGASQTKFRALKHENGIAGRATIIVRVIACFQPLQDCQAEYFRHLLKPVTQNYNQYLGDCFGWMVKVDSFQLYQQHPTEGPSNPSHMSSEAFQLGQQHSLPYCMNPHSFSPNVTFPMPSITGFYGLNTCQSNGAQRLFQHLPPQLEGSHLAQNPYDKESQCAFGKELRVKTAANNVAGVIQKRFFIFDQSGNQTRLFLSPCSPFPNLIAPETPVCACDQHGGKPIALMEQMSPTKLNIQWKSVANHLIGEESEMHEDTEEINALLYSDDEDEDDSDDLDDDDDEVISTGRSGHSPFACNGIHMKHALVEEREEEIASSDGSTKRQRLLDGGYKKLSLGDTAFSVKPNKTSDYYDDAESSYAKGSIQGEDIGPVVGNEQSRTEKIRATLRVLESIIPGIKGHNPLLAIDEAVSYLMSLKLKVKALGVGYP